MRDRVRRLLVLLVLLVLLATLCSTAPAHAEQKSLLRYSGAMGWRPFFMPEPDGTAVGLCPDIMQMVGKELDMPVEFRQMPWKRALMQLELGEIDVVCGIYPTAERKTLYDYSLPIADDDIRIFVKRVFPVQRLEDLKPLRGGKPLGSSFGDEFDSYAAANLTIEDTTDKVHSLRKLDSGRIDYFISAYADVMPTLKQMGLADSIRPLPLVVSSKTVHLAFTRKPGRQQVYDRVKEVVNRLVSEGVIDALYRKHLMN